MLKKSMLLLICLLSTTIAAYGRDKKVNLTVTNPTSSTLKVNITVKKSNGVVKQNIELGNVTQNGQVNRTFKVEVNGQYVVSAFIPGSAQVFEEAKTVVSDDPDPIAMTTTLAMTGTTLDANNSAQTLRNVFGRLGPNVGFSPIQVNNALKTVFGGLFLISPPKENGDAVVHFKLTPAQFSSEITPDQFQFPDTNDRQTVDVLTSATASVSASVPVISQIGINFSRDTVYRIDYDMTGFGAVEKEETATSSFATSLANLSVENKNALCQAIIRNPKDRLLYINKMFVIRSARFETKEGHRLSTGVKADAGTIVAGSAAYNYSSEQGRITNFTTSIVNIDGVELSFTKNDAGGVTGAITCDVASAAVPNNINSILGIGRPSAARMSLKLGVKPISNLSISRKTYKAMSQ